MINKKIIDLAEKLVLKNKRLSTVESCTGGMVSSAITSVSGSSNILDRTFVTYSNEAKIEMIGVDPKTIDKYGAVSEECALSMASGALLNANIEMALSITGIAGPNGGSKEKPVGLVYMAIARKDGFLKSEKYIFDGNRNEIREQATIKALELLNNN